MPLGLAQRKSNLPGGSGGNYTLAYTSTTAGGSLLVVMVIDQVAANVTAPTDSAGNTYVQAGSEFQFGSNYISIWYAKNATANAGTVTVHLTSTAFGRVVAIYEITGADTSAPLDTTKTGTSGSNVNTFATAQFTISSSEIICAMMVYVGTDPAAGTGFTLNFYGGFYSDEYGVFSSNQTANGTFPTTGSSYGILAASFKAAASGTTLTLAAASWLWTGVAPGVNAKTQLGLATATWHWTGQGPGINAKTMIALAIAAWNWTGQGLAINGQLILTLATAAWNWLAQGITINPVAALGRFLRSLGVGQ